MQKVNEVLNKQEINIDKADSVTIYYSNNGILKAKMQSKTFIHNTSAVPPYINMSNGLRVDFYSADGILNNTLTAKNGRYFEQSNNVIVTDSVVVKNIKNEKLQTQELIWNEKTQQFFTEKAVTITTPTQIIYGDGMQSNQDFSNYKILNVKGIIQVKSNKIPTQ